MKLQKMTLREVPNGSIVRIQGLWGVVGPRTLRYVGERGVDFWDVPARAVPMGEQVEAYITAGGKP